MEIRGEGLLLRPPAPEDVPVLVRHANSRAVWANLRDRFPHPYGAEDAHGWVAGVLQEGEPTATFAIVVDGEAVGGVGIERMGDVNRLVAEIGFWLGEACWGRGLATRAARLATAHAFACFDFERLEGHVFDWNPASARVLEKAGYRLDARLRRRIVKDGRIGDELIYARLRAAAAPDAQASRGTS